MFSVMHVNLRTLLDPLAYSSLKGVGMKSDLEMMANT